MGQSNLRNSRFVDFYNDSSMVFWTRKLNITQQQLSDAILNTGSLCVQDIKKYLGIVKPSFSFSELFGLKKQTKKELE